MKTKYINDVGHGLTQVIMEMTEANEVQATYTYGDDLISMKRNSGISEICGYYHYDGLGTVKQMTDSNGAVVEKYQYDAFGNSTIFSPSNEPRDTSSLGNAHGFTGEQQFNEADDLVFLRARYYDSSTGRFISRDPIGYKDSYNLYTYTSNNPVTYIDVDGLERERRDKPKECVKACQETHESMVKPSGCASECKGLGSVGVDACLIAAKKGLELCILGCARSDNMNDPKPPAAYEAARDAAYKICNCGD